MKKVIIYILTAAMLGIIPAYAAEGTPTVERITPDANIKNYNAIGVNQGEMKVYFSSAIDESVLNSLTELNF